MNDPLQQNFFSEALEKMHNEKHQMQFQDQRNIIQNQKIEAEDRKLEEVLWEAEQIRLGNSHLVVNKQMENYEARLEENSPRSLLEKARSFVEAVISIAKDAAPTKEIYDARINVCIECPAFEIAMEKPKQIGHCKACGCGKNPLSSLAVKAGIAKSSCPKKLWDVDLTIDPAAVALPIAPPPQ
jgi:hypothetical protein